MIVCKQIRLRGCCAGWLFYQSLSGLDSLTFSMHQKSTYVTASLTQVCTEFDVVRFFMAVKWWF